MIAIRHLTADEVAAELGRSADWLYRQWPVLVRDKGLPPPVAERPLAWSAAQFFVWLDRDLTPQQQAATAAYRAAAAAYVLSHIDPDAGRDIDASRARLDRRFAR